MGFEDEVEQSLQRPCRQTKRQVQADMRTHLIHRPARDIIPPLGGSRRGRLSSSHNRIRSETRNKPASPTRPICSVSLGFLGAINFAQGRLFASSCAAVSEHTLQYSQCPLLVGPATTFHGETWRLLLSCARRRNAAAGVYLPARSFGGRPRPLSRPSRRRPLPLPNYHAPSPAHPLGSLTLFRISFRPRSLV